MRNSKLILIGGLFFVACNSLTYDKADFPKNPFFDIKSYFENEMSRTFNKGVEKTTIVNGAVEKMNLDGIDLSKELKIFAESNLNKVSWYEKYSIDTVAQQTGGLKISYKSIDPELKTRAINIYQNGTEIDSIFIHNHLESMIMNTDQYLRYDSKLGYSLSIDQESQLQKADDYKITVRY